MVTVKQCASSAPWTVNQSKTKHQLNVTVTTGFNAIVWSMHLKVGGT